MDPAEGLARAKGRQGKEERFEDFGVELQEKMRAGFLALAQEFADRFRVVDGARPVEDVAADVRRLAEEALEETGACSRRTFIPPCRVRQRPAPCKIEFEAAYSCSRTQAGPPVTAPAQAPRFNSPSWGSPGLRTER